VTPLSHFSSRSEAQVRLPALSLSLFIIASMLFRSIGHQQAAALPLFCLLLSSSTVHGPPQLPLSSEAASGSSPPQSSPASHHHNAGRYFNSGTGLSDLLTALLLLSTSDFVLHGFFPDRSSVWGWSSRRSTAFSICSSVSYPRAAQYVSNSEIHPTRNQGPESF
jgi:hypothetical protein